MKQISSSNFSTTKSCAGAAFCAAVLLFCALPTTSRAQGIVEYKNRVFTNQGQSTVAEFAPKLAKAKDAIGTGKIDVYVGYHGDQQGEKCQDFSDQEWKEVEGMAKFFPNATLHDLRGKQMTDPEIVAAVKKGNVLFTWCDSDSRVRRVAGKDLGDAIKNHGH